MGLIEIGNLIENHIGQQTFGSDRGSVKQGFSPEVVRVLAEGIPLAGGAADLVFYPEEDGNILIGMEPCWR